MVVILDRGVGSMGMMVGAIVGSGMMANVVGMEVVAGAVVVVTTGVVAVVA